MVAEPHPTRMRSSFTPLTTGACPACYHYRSAAIDGQLHGAAIAQGEQRLAGNSSFAQTSTGEVQHAAERKHLRAVFRGGYVPHRLAFHPYRVLFRPQEAIGIDFQFHAAITENPFGDYGHLSTPFTFDGNNEWRRFVIRIGGTCADRGDELLWSGDDSSIPLALGIEEGDDLVAVLECPVKNHLGIEPHQFTGVIRVAVARTGPPVLDVAKDRAGVASNYVVGQDGFFRHEHLRVKMRFRRDPEFVSSSKS